MLSETPIEEINMGKNRLVSIPMEFEQLKDTLVSLWCDDNELSEFPICLCSLTSLTSLRMSSNMISSLPPSDSLGNLLLLETLVSNYIYIYYLFMNMFCIYGCTLYIYGIIVDGTTSNLNPNLYIVA